MTDKGFWCLDPPPWRKTLKPKLEWGGSQMCKWTKNLPIKAHLNKDKQVVDIHVHIMHWGLSTNQTSPSKWELSHSAKIISVMQYNSVNRAWNGFRRERSSFWWSVLRNFHILHFFWAHKSCHFIIILSEKEATRSWAALLVSHKSQPRSKFLARSPCTKLIYIFQLGHSAQSNWS